MSAVTPVHVPVPVPVPDPVPEGHSAKPSGVHSLASASDLSGHRCDVDVRLVFLDAEGQIAGVSSRKFALGAGEPERLLGPWSATIPAGACWGRVQLELTAGLDSASSRVYVDELTVEATPAPLVCWGERGERVGLFLEGERIGFRVYFPPGPNAARVVWQVTGAAGTSANPAAEGAATRFRRHGAPLGYGAEIPCRLPAGLYRLRVWLEEGSGSERGAAAAEWFAVLPLSDRCPLAAWERLGERLGGARFEGPLCEWSGGSRRAMRGTSRGLFLCFRDPGRLRDGWVLAVSLGDGFVTELCCKVTGERERLFFGAAVEPESSSGNEILVEPAPALYPCRL
jgi:hypothetical protein